MRYLAPIGALLGAAWALASCDRTAVPLPPHLSASTTQPTLAPQTSFTDDDLRHLLVRTRFAVTPAEYEELQRDGVPAFVDRILRHAPIGSQPFEQRARALINNPQQPVWSELVDWRLRLIEDNPNPTQEILALFWEDHFGMSQDAVAPSALSWMLPHVDLLRRHAFGNVRDLLLDMARDWVTLLVLDGISNRWQAPNENFAREFWELYSLGANGGYSEADIDEAARAFTGYDYRINRVTGVPYVVFEPKRKDEGDKVIFGVTIPGTALEDDFDEVIDITLARRPAAEWISTKLLEHFCWPNPPTALVDELAALMRASGFELRPVLRTLFLSQAFYSATARHSTVRGPLEWIMGAQRATGMRMAMDDLRTGLRLAGQSPTQCPSIEGWPVGGAWLASHTVIASINLLRDLISARTHQAGYGYELASLLPSPTATSQEVVDHLTWRLRVELMPAEHADCVTYLDTERQTTGEVVPSPFNPGSTLHLEERLRGLVYILGQHPTFLLR